jgi:hypothetical protein
MSGKLTRRELARLTIVGVSGDGAVIINAMTNNVNELEKRYEVPVGSTITVYAGEEEEDGGGHKFENLPPELLWPATIRGVRSEEALQHFREEGTE